MNQYARINLPYGLSTGELDVMRLVCKGHTPEEVAKIRGVNKGTIASQKTRAMRKLGVTTITDAIPLIDGIEENPRYCAICLMALGKMDD